VLGAVKPLTHPVFKVPLAFEAPGDAGVHLQHLPVKLSERRVCRTQNGAGGQRAKQVQPGGSAVQVCKLIMLV
jgi:hypothetical protein